MAPDLNSVPPSPRPQPLPTSNSHSASHHASQIPSRRPSHSTTMPPPLSPTLNILPSNQSTVTGQSIVAGGPPGGGGVMVGADNVGVGIGPGPLRHPRPLTAADLHLQLEKEQEAVVNRLTRELTLLRAAQNASVVSNTSSTSASVQSTSTGLPDTSDFNANHLLSGPSHPAPSQRRHHRSSSGASSRSLAAAGLVGAGMPSTTADRERRPVGTRVDSGGAGVGGGLSMSRQNSSSYRERERRSGASSPALLPGSYHESTFPLLYNSARPISIQRESSTSIPSLAGERGVGVELSGRYEELTYHRLEMENVRRENEGLRRRIRELEGLVRAGGDRARSESVSTAATMEGVRGRERAESGLEEGGVRVGER